MKRLLIVCTTFLLFGAGHLLSQVPAPTIAKLVVNNGDTIPMIELSRVYIWAPKIFSSKQEERKYNRLVRNVKRVYPYAHLAGQKLRDYELVLRAAKNDTERKRIMKQAEAELKEEYGEDLKKLTYSQGHILIKLVDRETGNSTYGLLQDLRGNFMAFFWQNFARIFGYNLKDKYDPAGKDKDIENIVLMIESGAL